MNFRDACELRTQLRQVNVEYSALVRDKCGAGRFVRMGELRAERRALMTLMRAGVSGVRRALAHEQRQPLADTPSSTRSSWERGRAAPAGGHYEDVDRL